MTIHVSIIIPSAGRRSEFLQRSIKSALFDDEHIQTEIIVVLNGKDGMAFDTSLSFQHSLVSYHKLPQGNVCKARNYGLSLAQGELIRFLDDDDYLYPEVAYKQYIELFGSNADLSTYAGAIEDENIRYQVIKIIDINDYCAATLSAHCPALTFATVYKSKVIKHLKWDEDIFVVEDEKWMRTISASTEIEWIKSNDVVAVWYQHDIDRLSVPIFYSNPKLFIERKKSIQDTLKTLKSENRLTSIRIISASYGLWSCIHGGFHFSPMYWTKTALFARKLNPNSKPENAFFEKLYFIHPILLEWLLIPIRWISRYYRMLKGHFLATSYVRKL